jgi:hypothetical protein
VIVCLKLNYVCMGFACHFQLCCCCIMISLYRTCYIYMYSVWYLFNTVYWNGLWRGVNNQIYIMHVWCMALAQYSFFIFFEVWRVMGAWVNERPTSPWKYQHTNKWADKWFGLLICCWVVIRAFTSNQTRMLKKWKWNKIIHCIQLFKIINIIESIFLPKIVFALKIIA